MLLRRFGCIFRRKKRKKVSYNYQNLVCTWPITDKSVYTTLSLQRNIIKMSNSSNHETSPLVIILPLQQLSNRFWIAMTLLGGVLVATIIGFSVHSSSADETKQLMLLHVVWWWEKYFSGVLSRARWFSRWSGMAEGRRWRRIRMIRTWIKRIFRTDGGN